MNLRRTSTLAFRAAVFSAWSLALSVAGLWLLASPPRELTALRPAFVSGGLAALAGGQVLFMTMVADRFFPRAAPRLVAGVELMATGLFFAGSGAFAWLYLTGGAS